MMGRSFIQKLGLKTVSLDQKGQSNSLPGRASALHVAILGLISGIPYPYGTLSNARS